MRAGTVMLLILAAGVLAEAKPGRGQLKHHGKPADGSLARAGRTDHLADENLDRTAEHKTNPNDNREKKVEEPWKICYYTNWSQYRPVPGEFWPGDIDPFLCTHIYYAFSDMEDNLLVPFEVNDYQLYAEVNSLKLLNPSLKTVLAVGGWTHGTGAMTMMLSSKLNRTIFIDNAIETITTHGFDGIDLDFEYPGSRGSPTYDKFLFTCLFREMRNAIDLYNSLNGAQLVFTAGVAAGIENIQNGYEIPEIAQNVDKVNLMAYDFFVGIENRTNAHSPLHPRQDMLMPGDKLRNVATAAQYWLDGGCPRHKLVIGLADYGRGFTLRNPFNNGLEAPAIAENRAYNFTRTPGIISYYELCSMFLPNAQIEFDMEGRVPYAYLEDQWIGYENIISITEKAEYIRQNLFGGYMLWAIDNDDFSGMFCGGIRYPMTNAVNNALQGYLVPIDEVDDTVPPPDLTFCQVRPDGYHEDPESCARFYECTNGATQVQFCNPGQIYDPFFSGCRLPGEMDATWVCENCAQYCDRSYCE